MEQVITNGSGIARYDINFMKENVMVKYVFCAFVETTYSPKPTNRVNITEKAEWDADEGCNDDGIDETDPDIIDILQELKLRQESECNFVTDISLDIAIDKLIAHPSFEYNQEFHDFMVESYK
jgi:hypothetical protein